MLNFQEQNILDVDISDISINFFFNLKEEKIFKGEDYLKELFGKEEKLVEKFHLEILDQNLSEENFRHLLNLRESWNLLSEKNLYISIYDINYELRNDLDTEKRKEIIRNVMLDLNKKFELDFIYIYEHYFFWFKDFYQKILETESVLINGESSINKIWKYYIAIMTVCSGKSEYLLKILEGRFLASGGDKNWLITGLDIVPLKLKKLAILVNMICHQPWKIKEEDLKVF